jgi:uncharacterized protein YciI
MNKDSSKLKAHRERAHRERLGSEKAGRLKVGGPRKAITKTRKGEGKKKLYHA